MDIFAHALWTNALAQTGNDILEKKHARKIKVPWAMFWGVFPDLFAFGIAVIISVPVIISGIFSHASWYSLFPNLTLAHDLYNYSHSLIFFSLAFLLAWVLYRRPRFELLGWALHILIDIPSHTNSFFPTPFLFPISNYHFPYGLSWADQRYMIVNYSLLAITFIYLFLYKRQTYA